MKRNDKILHYRGLNR
ncbi:TPA: hypothetical protein ACM342_000701 [Escherichia coli]